MKARIRRSHLAITTACLAAACSGHGPTASSTTVWDCADESVPLGRRFTCVSAIASGVAQDGPAYVCSGDGDANVDCPPMSGGASDGGTTGVGSPADAGGSSCDSPDATSGFYCTKQGGRRECHRTPSCDPGAHAVQMDCEPDTSTGLGSGSSGGYQCGGSGGSLPGGQTQCFYPAGTPANGGSPPAATFEYVLETIQGASQLHTRLTFNPAFVDNSYGATAIGWPKGHKFAELVGSDHAELSFTDAAGTERLHFKLDYLSKSTSAPSGYACLGVLGGEGRMILGDPSAITRAVTSLDRNLNERGYASFVVDSPASDASYSPPAPAPLWDFRVVYETWIWNTAFGSSGFGNVVLTFVHASPSKSGSNTLPVTPGPCPPDWGGGSSGTTTIK